MNSQGDNLLMAESTEGLLGHYVWGSSRVARRVVALRTDILDELRRSIFKLGRAF